MRSKDARGLFQRPGGYLLLALILLLAALLALRAGSAPIGWKAFWGGLCRPESYQTESVILFKIRLPRIAAAILAGAGLSVSGALLQGVTGNALAGPNIIGVNAGAFLTTLLIVSLAARINQAKSTVILAGIAITAMLNAGISLLSLLEPDLLASYNYVSIGGLSNVRAGALGLPAVIILAGLLLALLLSRRIDTLCLGDQLAASLGIRVRRLRMLCLVIASACAAAVVSFAGLLGFVGLIVPHMARKMAGSSMHRLLPVSVLTGATLVPVADLLGRVLFAPSELPVGIVMAFIGAPFFFWLLLKRRNYADL